ncbi:MAG: DUF6089 family protein [Microscillaceae bacterium]|jgi:hypothetical protein|nr:DUF6089 family protein [Microscillaceae bacterium]
MLRKTILSIFAFTLFFTGTLLAQTHEIGVQAGVANYKGELAKTGNLTSPGPMAQVFYRANISKTVSLRANASFGRLAYDATKSNDGNINSIPHQFKTNVWELGGQVEYNFLNFRGNSKKVSTAWTPYAFAGVGLFKFEPLLNIQPTYRTLTMNVPLGVGFKGIMSGNWNWGVEFGARFTFTDYLDDFGRNTTQGSIKPIQFTENSNNKDMYFFTGISISYVFPSLKKDCPVQVAF